MISDKSNLDPLTDRVYLKKVAASSLFNSLISAVAAALLLPMVIRQIGMDAYGMWAVLGLFVGVTSFLDFGFLKSLVYLGARGEYTPAQLLCSAGVMCLLSASIFSIALFVVLFFDFPVFGHLYQNQPELRWWLAASGGVMVFSGLLTNLARGVMEAAYRIHWVNIGYALLTLLQYAVAAVIAYSSHDVKLLLVGTAGVYFLIFLFHYICLKVLIGLRWCYPSISIMKSIVRYGASAFLADLPTILLAPLLSYCFVLVADRAGDFGVFDLSLRMSTLAVTALSMISTPFFAMVAGAHAHGQESVRRLMGRYLRLNMLLAVCGWTIFLLLGPMLIKMFFPDRPEEIHRATLIILSGAALVAVMEPVARMLMGLDRLRQLAMVRFAMLIGALLVVWLLDRLLPLDRFAVACGFGYLVSAVGLVWLNHVESWGRNRP